MPVAVRSKSTGDIREQRLVALDLWFEIQRLHTDNPGFALGFEVEPTD